MEILNVNHLFNELKQDEQSDIQLLKVIDGITAMFIAELKAGKKLPEHYHNEGIEIYQILSGEGTIKLGEVSGESIDWHGTFTLRAGDVLEVKPKVIHGLSNNSDEALRFIFFAPPSHVGEDRVFV